tara:strand:- start:245 stop:451 length:207 start_codon:yes stop_codon:yes gene_type:complete
MPILLVFLFFILSSTKAFAYLGPGLGLGLLGSIIGLLLSIFIFIFAILWFPLKKLFKTKKKKTKEDNK